MPVEWPDPVGGGLVAEFFREDRAFANDASLWRRDVLDHSLEENLRHHALVFVIEEMAVKDGHAPDDGIGEVHNHVDGTAVWNIHGVQPQGVGNWFIVFCIRQEMDLMDVYGMEFA